MLKIAYHHYWRLQVGALKNSVKTKQQASGAKNNDSSGYRTANTLVVASFSEVGIG